MKEMLKKTNIVHQGLFMDIYEDDVILPTNKLGKRIYIKHPGGSGILAMTPDNRVILVKQFRYAIQQYIIEIPAGKHDLDDDPLLTAKRELAEETGYTSDEMSFLTSIYPTPGYSNEIITIYLAKNAYEMPMKIKGDDDEFIRVLFYNQEDVKSLLASDQIIDAKTLIALHYYVNMVLS